MVKRSFGVFIALLLLVTAFNIAPRAETDSFSVTYDFKDLTVTAPYGVNAVALFVSYSERRLISLEIIWDIGLDEGINIVSPQIAGPAAGADKFSVFLWKTFENIAPLCAWHINLTNLDGLVDFVVDVDGGREIRILQLSDTQIIDSGQKRKPEDLNDADTARWATDTVEDNCYKYIRQMVERANPDLILIAGDVIYGKFDDAGTALEGIVALMETLRTPWAPVFGNHDNESRKGVEWQCQQFIDAENCMFKRGDVEVRGNGNYTIGIRQGGELVRVVYMVDSNGCGGAHDDDSVVKKSAGFSQNQKDWIDATAKTIESAFSKKVPSFICYHIPTSEFTDAVVAAGYQPEPDTADVIYKYTIGEGGVNARNGDFGSKGEEFKGEYVSEGLLGILKGNNFDGVFVGHSHRNNVSVLYEGIRWTFGLKTGLYDRYTHGQVGGTYIEVDEGGETFSVEHVYYDPYYGVEDTDKVEGFKAGDFNVASVLSKLEPTADKLSDGTVTYYAYKYSNNTVNDNTTNRCLFLKPSVFTEEILSAEGAKISFDVLIPSGNPAIDGNHFIFRVKSADKNSGSSIKYPVKSYGFELDKWNHIEIRLDTLLNYTELGDPKTHFGFYTASGSVLYFANMKFELPD